MSIQDAKGKRRVRRERKSLADAWQRRCNAVERADDNWRKACKSISRQFTCRNEDIL